MLEKQQHEKYLKEVLRRLIAIPELGTQLILKGGTCLYLFYDLPRFSVDLDFNLKVNTHFNPDLVTKVLEKELTLKETREKYHTWFWLGQYEKGRHHIKIEVSKRVFPDTYLIHSFYGLSVITLAPPSLFAHKLCAITDRSKLQNRDLYDTWFMFKKGFSIDENIIQLRMNKTLGEYLDELRIFIDKEVNPHTLLEGLGELLSESQKNWVKESLLSELIFQIDLKRDSILLY